MAYLLGTDEAGYGPNLGPLVVSATLWQVPDECCRRDLYDVLAEVVTAKSEDSRVAIADSKNLYQSGQGLGNLERGVLSLLNAATSSPSSWREMWHALSPSSSSERDAIPWYQDFDTSIPVDCPSHDVGAAAASLQRELTQCRVACQDIRSVAVFPQRFNGLVDEHGNKASALSQVTLQLVRELIEPLVDDPIIIQCDKHGGRNRYGPLLQELFPDYLVEVYKEGRAASLYRWGPPDRRVEISFVAGGESFLPSALASMASKYLRELAMLAFNDFWRKHVPDIRPTAGYPIDARRFRAEIQAAQKRLGIDDAVLWRNR